VAVCDNADGFTSERPLNKISAIRTLARIMQTFRIPESFKLCAGREIW